MIPRFSVLPFLLLPLTRTQSIPDSSGFYVDENGVVVCEDAPFGSSTELELFDGTKRVFTKVSRQDLLDLVASAEWSSLGTSCTSGVTDMSNLFLGQETFGQGGDESLGGDVPLSHWDVRAVEAMDAMVRLHSDRWLIPLDPSSLPVIAPRLAGRSLSPSSDVVVLRCEFLQPGPEPLEHVQRDIVR